MTTDTILSRREGPIGSLIFNNPAKHNAVSLEMWQRSTQVLHEFAEDPAIRVIVLSGAGDKAFISGADISKFEDERAGAEGQARYTAASAAMRRALRDIGKPTVAMIKGWCLGGGMAVAVNCDLRICADDAQFGIPAAKLGVGYGIDGLEPLVQLVGPSFAKEFLYTAKRYTADEASRMGLVNQVVPAAELAATVQAYVEGMARNAPLTQVAAKVVIDELMKHGAARNSALCNRVVERANLSQDHVEGRHAFMEKRKPVFTGR
jgi:enoyl-CoA hydratase/carnithine racemase